MPATMFEITFWLERAMIAITPAIQMRMMVTLKSRRPGREIPTAIMMRMTRINPVRMSSWSFLSRWLMRIRRWWLMMRPRTQAMTIPITKKRTSRGLIVAKKSFSEVTSDSAPVRFDRARLKISVRLNSCPPP